MEKDLILGRGLRQVGEKPFYLLSSFVTKALILERGLRRIELLSQVYKTCTWKRI